MPDYEWASTINNAAVTLTSAATNTATLIQSGTYTTAGGYTVAAYTILDTFLKVAYTTVTGVVGEIVWNEWPRPGTIAGAPFVPRKRTAEEIEAEIRLHAEYEKKNAERRARELAAKARAEKLLLANLTPEQRDTLTGRGFFELHTRSGKRYRVERRTHGNVFLVDMNGNATARLCAQPNGVPVDDAILAQKLALETDEDAFLKVANVTRYG